MTDAAELDAQIKTLATNLRLGSSILTVYKELELTDRGEFVRDLLAGI